MLPPEDCRSMRHSFPLEKRVEILTWIGRHARLKPQGVLAAYLAGRGISYQTAAAAGVCSRSTDYEKASDRIKQQFRKEDLQGAGILNEKGNLVFYRHRLIFPYWLNGEVLGMQARNTEWRSKEQDGAKELTIGPRTIPYHADILLDDQAEVYVVEGALDTLSLAELGLPAVGIPGASNFKPAWVNLFDAAEDVILALDADRAGRQGAADIADIFRRHGRQVRYLNWPAGIKDANDNLLSLRGGREGE
jgi:DNA primase